jgi:putative transposase
VAVVLEAYVDGVSTRKVDRLVEQLWIAVMINDRVSALCGALDEPGSPRSGSVRWKAPTRICGWMLKHVKVRSGGHVRSKALVIAYVVHESAVLEVTGLDLGEVESEAFWVEFIRSLRARGLSGVCLGDL